MTTGSLEEVLDAARRLSLSQRRLLVEELLRDLGLVTNGGDLKARQKPDPVKKESADDPMRSNTLKDWRGSAAADLAEEESTDDPMRIDTLADLRGGVSATQLVEKSSRASGPTQEALEAVERTHGTMKGLDRRTVIWLAEDEELCGY